MRKIIICDTTVVVNFDNGVTLQNDNISNEDILKIMDKNTPDSVIIKILDPEQESKLLCKANTIKQLIKRVSNSNILSFKGDYYIWKEVSNLSLPPSLMEAILNAEEEQDELKLETYKNFWTLMCLNPNEQCRHNLFWFLERYGMTISRCGFFVAYRNVRSTHKVDENNNPIYTDDHSRTFRIQIGKMVTMDRTKCDDNQDVTCSRGLHCAGASWLERNYFGDTGLVCLINPADVVAVPHEDNYGKLRTCAYLPITYASFEENGHIKPYDEKDGFECPYIQEVIYEGLMGTEEDSPYRITIPEYLDKTIISNSLLDMAMRCITDRLVK